MCNFANKTCINAKVTITFHHSAICRMLRITQAVERLENML